MTNPSADFSFAPMVPELLVSDLDASLHFYCDLTGFSVAYARPDEGFAYLDCGGAQIMLEQASAPGRHWITGPLERPFGRGVNFQISVEDADTLADKFLAAGWPIFLPLETKIYRTGERSVTQRQFAEQDPDGYLLRFSQALVDAPD